MLTGSRFKIQRKNSSTEHFPGPASRPCLCNQMATPPTSQYFLPVALAQAGIPLPVGENTSNSLSHGGTLGTAAFASSNELDHDKGGSRVQLYKVRLIMKKMIARFIHSPSMPVDVGDRWFIDGSLLQVLMFRGSAM